MGYFSKKLNNTEKHYLIVEKELFAIVKAILFFMNTIQGYFTTVCSDNQNCMTTKPSNSPRMKRWQLLLQDFNIELKRIEGNNNNIADELSRITVLKNSTQTKKEDKFKRKLLECLTTEKDASKRYIVNKEKDKELIEYIHKLSGHVGVTKTYENIHKYYKIDNVKSKVAEAVKNCKKCNKYKIKIETKKHSVKLYSKEMFYKISTDTYGQFSLERINHDKTNEKGYFITITDIYSKLTEIYFTYEVTGQKIIRAIEKWIARYKKPKYLISDNGTEFRNN